MTSVEVTRGNGQACMGVPDTGSLIPPAVIAKMCEKIVHLALDQFLLIARFEKKADQEIRKQALVESLDDLSQARRPADERKQFNFANGHNESERNRS